MKRTIGIPIILLLIFLLVQPVFGQGINFVEFRAIRVLQDLIVDDDITVSGDLTVSGTTTVDALVDTEGPVVFADTVSITGNTVVTGTLDVVGAVDGLTQTINTAENIGMLPTIASAAIISTTDEAVFTVGEGEIWIIHDVLLQVTTNFDCTGNDCMLDVGRTGDADGYIDAADAHLQAAVTDYTGGQAGWTGMDGAAPRGALLIGGPDVVDATGGAVSITATVGGTDPAAGDATVWIIYTRIQ